MTFYVGPHEKEQFLSFLNKKLRDRKLETLVPRTINFLSLKQAW
jgi:hypothetical protein